MGSVYKRGDSSNWWVSVFVRTDRKPQGEWVDRSTGVKDRRLAERVLAEIEAREARGQKTPGKSRTVADWTDEAVLAWKNTNAGPDARNIRNHVLPVIGATPLVDVTEADLLGMLHGWRDAKAEDGSARFAPRTLHNLWWLVQRLFAGAVKAKHLARSPVPELEKGDLPRKRDKDPRWRRGAVFTRGEAQQLLDGPDAWRRIIWALGFFTGMRLGEISALRWRDYDEAREDLGCLHVAASYTRVNKREKGTKTEVPREVPVHPELAAALVEWRRLGWKEYFGRKPEPGDLLVPNQAGRHLTDNNVNGIRDVDFARLGLRRRRFHDTRRTFFSLIQVDGAPRDVALAITHDPDEGTRGSGETYTTFPWPTLCAAVRGLKLTRRPPVRGVPTSRSTGTSEEDSTMRDDNENEVPKKGFEAFLDRGHRTSTDDNPEGEDVGEQPRPARADGDRRTAGKIPDLPARLKRLVARFPGADRPLPKVGGGGR